MDWPLGVCAWIFGGRPLRALAADLASWGYDGLEIAGEPDLHTPAEIRAVLGDRGLRVLGVTASCDWPTDSRDLAHPDPSVRRRAVDHFRRCLDLAHAVGAPFVGLLPGACGRSRALADARDEWRWSVEGTREVATHASSAGIPVVVEALNRYETHLVNSADQAVAYIEEVDSPMLGIALDAFHMNIEEADPQTAIRRAGARLRAFHVADSNRAGLGCGHLDLALHLSALGEGEYRGALTVECTAPGPDPFTAVHDAESLGILRRYARETAERLRTAMET